MGFGPAASCLPLKSARIRWSVARDGARLARRPELEGDASVNADRSSLAASFTDYQVLDLGLYWDTSEIRRKSVHHVAEQLEKLVNEQQKWTSILPGGLLVVTRSEEQEALAEWKRQRDEVVRQREAEAKEGESAD